MKRLIIKSTRLKPLVLHLFAWLAIGSLIFLSQPDIRTTSPFFQYTILFRKVNLVLLQLLVGLFYINSYLLVPRLLFRKKTIVFIGVQLILLVLMILGINFVFDTLANNMPSSFPKLYPPFFEQGVNSENQPFVFRLPWGITVLSFCMTVTTSIAFCYITAGIQQENLRKEEKMATLTSELQFLKSQVSPHFLFNVLNILTFLARKQSVALEPALIKLSSLLRYMLYDTDEEKVLFDKEIRYLQDYIALQQMRHHDLRVNTFFNNDDDQLFIAPMLLIPFVENAFKHAGGFVGNPSFIKIELINYNGIIHFSVLNKCSNTQPEQTDKSSGIGLANVKKRLQLLYPGHMLSLERLDDVFLVTLHLNL